MQSTRPKDRTDPMNALSMPAPNASFALISHDQSGVDELARLRFLGVSFDRLTMPDVVSLLLTRQAEAPFASVVTPNVAHVVRIADTDEEVAPAYRNAWLCLNDSRIVEALARSRGLALPATPGADLVVNLLSAPEFDRSSPVLLVGGDAQLFEALVGKTSLTNARHFDAPMGLLTDPEAFDATVNFIETHPARFVLLAVGSPQQELLAEALRARGIARGVGLCIGAAVEFLVGRRRRAPAWMSKRGLEWLFRLLSEPRRMWRRYVIDSPKILRLYLQELRR
jgi:exopolysaccharide biosynthesis WecB/TagA/CpsF family protein